MKLHHHLQTLKAVPVKHAVAAYHHTLAVADGEAKPPRWVNRSTYFLMLGHLGLYVFGFAGLNKEVMVVLFTLRAFSIGFAKRKEDVAVAAAKATATEAAAELAEEAAEEIEEESEK